MMTTSTFERGPIQQENKVKSIEKLPSGALKVTQHSGNTFEVSQEEELFQAFTVYSMLAGL